LTRSDPTAFHSEARFTVVWLDGEHDASTKVAVRAVIDNAANLDDADVLVDLSGVTFMDASIIGTLIGARQSLGKRFLTLEVRAPSPFARRLLEICGLTELEQSSERMELERNDAAPALATWVDVPTKKPRHLAIVADTPEASMAEVERRSS
ncbi:MAG TPA: STAS domain-containing protein, partial [Aeromicrobium sp.]|nr:STAS domain-containing protein [Aeromicrobium sp.]